MYEFFTAHERTRKKIIQYIKRRKDIKKKLRKLQENPRRKELEAHRLQGIFCGKWRCSLGNNLRLIYVTDDKNKRIIALRIGNHKIDS